MEGRGHNCQNSDSDGDGPSGIFMSSPATALHVLLEESDVDERLMRNYPHPFTCPAVCIAPGVTSDLV